MAPPSRSPSDTSVVETTADSFPPVFFGSPDSFPPVQLGASDIDTIVKALLPPLAGVLSKLTNEQLYVGLFTQISKLSLGKTFANDDELASLVQDISKQVVEQITEQIVNPDDAGCPSGYTDFFGNCVVFIV